MAGSITHHCNGGSSGRITGAQPDPRHHIACGRDEFLVSDAKSIQFRIQNGFANSSTHAGRDWETRVTFVSPGPVQCSVRRHSVQPSAGFSCRDCRRNRRRLSDLRVRQRRRCLQLQESPQNRLVMIQHVETDCSRRNAQIAHSSHVSTQRRIVALVAGSSAASASNIDWRGHDGQTA